MSQCVECGRDMHPMDASVSLVCFPYCHWRERSRGERGCVPTHQERQRRSQDRVPQGVNKPGSERVGRTSLGFPDVSEGIGLSNQDE